TGSRSRMRPRSGSSSALSLTAERTRSPKSCGAKPGIVVSRSTTQSASPLLASNSTFAILASLWTGRSSISPRPVGRVARRGQAAARVVAHDGLEGEKPRGRVVEAWDRRVQLRRGQVGELPLEAPEGARGLVRLGLARRAVERERALDPRHQTPGLAARVEPGRPAL